MSSRKLGLAQPKINNFGKCLDARQVLEFGRWYSIKRSLQIINLFRVPSMVYTSKLDASLYRFFYTVYKKSLSRCSWDQHNEVLVTPVN